MADEVSDLASRLGCGTEIAAYAVAFHFTPKLMRDDGRRGSDRCSLWECDGGFALVSSGRTIWDIEEDFDEILAECGFEIEDDDDDDDE